MSNIRHLWELRPIWLTILAFILPVALLVIDDPETEKVRKCAYIVIIMAILWLTETLPIPVTSLMPIFLFPMAGVASAKEMSGSYVTDTTMLFLGGLIIAVALEESGLHIRISLLVMTLVGAQPIFLMLGLTITTWFLSMWISNTAATSMMVPIISAVITTVENVNFGDDGGEDNEGYQMDSVDTIDKAGSENKQNGTKYEVTTELPRASGKSMTREEMNRLSKGLALCVAYGANIGGIATLTGTPPNLVLKNKADELYADYSGESTTESPISFAKWMGFAFPLSLITVIVGWLWLVIAFLRGTCCRRLSKETKLAINNTIKKQFKALGRITVCEIQVLVVFILLIILWLFRKPPNDVSGWGEIFESGTVSDSTPCILLSVLLFILPAKKPNVFGNHEPGTAPSYTAILNWKTTCQKLPWGVILLLGGGFALAKACQISGLSEWIGLELKKFEDYDTWVMNLLICIAVAVLTELTSNTATATLLMPILSALAISIDVHPLYLMMSSTIACSFAFMLPVATPPNAIVFSTGYVSVFDMFMVGIPMNIVAILILTLAINTWGKAMFDLDTLPDFFTNVTTT